MESSTEPARGSLGEKSVDKELKVDLRNVNPNESTLNSKKAVVVNESADSLKINTIQNIYDSKSPQIPELQRNSSFRNRILKTDYIKLHRQNFVSIRNSSVDKLKGKYESIAKQADYDSKLNTGVRTKVNTDSKSTNKGTCVISSQEDETKNNTSASRTVLKTKSKSSNETIVEVDQFNTERDKTNYLTRTTSNIEKLQNNLSSKLSNETIERLKYRYSPASFGYTNKKNIIPKDSVSAEEASSKIPVPTPRKTISINSDREQKIESVTIKLTTVDVPKCFSVEKATEIKGPAEKIVSEKDENSNLISEAPAEEALQTVPKIDNLETKPLDSKVDDGKNSNLISGAPFVEEGRQTVSKIDDPQASPLDSEVDDGKNLNLIPEGPVVEETRQTVSKTNPVGSVVDDEKSPSTAIDVTYNHIEFAEPEAKHFILKKSSSEDSVDKVENFLSEIIMDKRTKEKKRSNSFKRLAGIFGRDKKKVDGDKLKQKKDNEVFSDNAQNESQAFDRNSSYRHTTDNSFSRLEVQRQNAYPHPHNTINPSYEQYQKHPDDRHSRGRYTEMKGSNVTSFRPNRQHFPGEDYVPMSNGNLEKSKNAPTYININKYGDSSSSSSNTLDSDRNCTYQNALIAQAEMRKLQHNENVQRMQRSANSKPSHNSPDNRFVSYDKYQNSPEAFRNSESNNLQLVKPKAHIPINSERPLPNPYHNSHDDSVEKYEVMESAKTLDRNLNVDNSKTYALKNNLYNSNEDTNKVHNDSVVVVIEDIYGTVFDNIAPRNALQNNLVQQTRITTPDHSVNSSSTCSSPTYRPQLSPKSLEGSKLKLPSNREKIDLQPRIRSPLPQVKISTDKIIATELLRNKRSPSRESSSLEDLKPKLSPNSMQTSTRMTSPNYHNGNSLRKQLPHQANPSLRNIDRVDSNSEFVYLNLESPQRKSLPNQTEWQRKPRELNDSHSNVTTSVVIHANPEERARRNYGSLPVGRQAAQVHEGTYGSGKPPSVGSLNSPSNNVRAQTPQQLPPSPVQRSPEKQHIIHNVEAFYWRELKKLKEREEEELAQYRQQQLNVYGYVEDPVFIRRSRSVSPSMRRAQRSLSLPRDGRPNVSQERCGVHNQRRDNSPMLRPGRQLINGHEVILEGRPLIAKQPIALPANSTYGQVRQPTFQRNPHFVRNAFERSTIGPIGMSKDGRNDFENQTRDSQQLYMPIFKRGSLTGNANVADSQMSKKVSFSNNANVNVSGWPTKNGYTRSPPTRRIERESSMEDDVFLPNSPRSSANISAINSSPRSHQEQIYQNQGGYYVRPDTSVVDYGGRKLQELPQHEIEKLYIRTSPKHITVSNKVCDIYGKIHDNEQKQAMANDRALVASRNYGQVKQVGLVYGHLQQTRNPENEVILRSHNQLNSPNNNFVRGTRLTASVNDMYKRYPSDNPQYGMQQRRLNESIYSSERTTQAPFRPLPPIPSQQDSRLPLMKKTVRGNANVSSAESGSESGEVQRIFQSGTKQRNINVIEEEWNSDGKLGRGSGNESGGSRGENEGEVKSSRSRSARREDPRRHTLSGDQHYGMAGQGGPLSRTMDLEGQFARGYPPSSNAMLFDDDPGIMSEVETSSTGFRRGGKQRSSLPVVRTPSKTLERPLGLVFLQYRNETKRALLPNEITSIDTVKALFVRSFPKQLSMEYLDSPLVKIYIHDSSKDMFYELEDVRSHLREIRDRSVLRLFESTDVSGGLPMGGVGIPGGVGHFEDPSYFSEPEFDSEYQHQHIHKSKGNAGKSAPYYMGSTSSLPRGGPLLRPYSPAVNTLPSDRMKTLPAGAPPKPQRAYSSGATRASDGSSRPPDRFAPFQRPANPLFNLPDGYMSSPERGSRGYEDPYYSQYTSRSGSITPVIDEEISDTELLDEQYSLYGVKIAPGGPRNVRAQFPGPAAPPYDATRTSSLSRLRVEHMERQLANLTGLVQKALTQTPPTRDFLAPPGRDAYRSGDEFDKNSSSSSASIQDDSYLRSDSNKAPKLGKSCHKSVSFEKSVSFSDEPPDMNSPKQHSPQHTADTKPPKPAIKSSTLPRTSSQEKDRLKPAPPPKPASLSPGQYDGRHIYRDLQLTPEMYNQLRGLQKKAKDLRAEVRNLRRMSQAQAHSVRETIRDTFIKIRAMLVAGGEQVWQADLDQERVRLSRDEDLYKQEMLRLEKDLTDLESSVEELRGNVINRKTRVNMSDVENMALVLSKSSKTVADLKLRFPGLQDTMKAFLSSEMDKVVREEKFLKEEPERLESALRRCKKLTGTLVTLKRLASVQEQRLPNATGTPDGRISPDATETPPVTPTSAQHSKPPTGARMGQVSFGGDSADGSDSSQRPENALDALLDELQTFSKPHSATVNTQMPQASYSDSTPSDPPAIPVKGIPPSHSAHFSHPHMSEIGRKGSMDSASLLPTQNLTVSTATGSLRRLHSYPSGSDTDNSPPIQPPRSSLDGKSFTKPPIPERNSELLQHVTNRRVPPPPPPRTSSKSPLASPTSPSLPPRSPATGLQHIQNVQNMAEKPMSQFEAATQNLGLSTLRRNVPNRSSIKDNKAQTLPRNIGSNLQLHTQVVPTTGSELQNVSSSSCESVNSQDGTKKGTRKEELEQRHQELLKKQKALQEQYARLQQLQRGNNTLVAVVPPAPDQLLKKTGSESNLLQKMGLQMATTQMTGSLTNLPSTTTNSTNMSTPTTAVTTDANTTDNSSSSSTTTTSKVYETDIL